jgi:primosomal protein N' (replication factor Y)
LTDRKFAKIIINISHENVDRPYTYKVPEELLARTDIGSVVNVPFGKGDTLRKGVIIGFSSDADFDESKIKEIASIEEKDLSFSDSRIRLAAWIKKNYGSTFSAALKTVLPVKRKVNTPVKKAIVRLVSEDKIKEEIAAIENSNKVARLRLLDALSRDDIIPREIAVNKLHISEPTIKKLCEDGIIKVAEVAEKAEERVLSDPPVLSIEQNAIADAVKKDFDEGHPGKYLIHGITGSGKTEVYMSIIGDVIKRGRQAIVLIPEIALTFQTLMRFYDRFGNRVLVMNSTLSDGEKYLCFEKAKNGEADIVIGPRSALFTPFKDLGVIVIDEEHEGTYKSETVPKYHARETAEELARMSGAALVLGSATPSVDAYYKAVKGDYVLFELNTRPTGNSLANVHIADLREELRKGNKTIISKKLQGMIEDRLQKGEQTMLFINRRGLAGFVSCRACGFVVKCPHCDVSLSLHKNNTLTCHYCGYTIPKMTVCPECGSKYISGFKAGTEQVEETVKKMYPEARVLRMDADTTRQKDSYEKILSSFLNKEADILIGTQMIVKGHDFKNVTLVGVLAADQTLFDADYKAAERTFDLITQAAGRAGRGDVPGDVVIQTYKPDHYAIVHAASQDYKAFYEEEIAYRDFLNYPPTGHMLSVLVTGKDEEETGKFTDQMCKALKKYFDSTVIGPAPAFISKLNDIYRFVFYIKNVDYDKLVEIKDYLEDNLSRIKKKNTLVFFDFDPYGMQ